jgi:hypothetical protein
MFVRAPAAASPRDLTSARPGLAGTTGRLAGVTAAIALGGCTGETGTISISLVTAPDSTVLDPATKLRATLSSPLTIAEADRGPDGFALSLEVPADARNAVVALEAFDAAGQVIAVGATPPLPLVALDADIAIYLAAPRSLASAPVALDPPRAELGAVGLPYGVLFAGGSTLSGPSDALEIYSAYDHTLLPGEDLPGARRGVSAGYSVSGYAYLFGGVDDAGADSGTLWRFDTEAQPAGTYVEIDDDPAVARAGEAMAPLGYEQFLVTGEPPVVANGLSGLSAVSTLLQLPPVAVSVQAAVTDAPVYTVIAGQTAGFAGVVVLTDGTFADASAPASAQRTGHGAVPTPDTEVVVIGGGTTEGLVTSALRINPATRAVTELPDVLVTARVGAAIATNGEILVVAGGTDATGTVLADAEIIDLATLTPIAVIPMVVPRTNATARSLPNGQVLIAGGLDATGAPVGTIELFTPEITP